jgi:hypothetical protein
MKTMNDFTGKKLGEVLAFAQVGSETFQRGRVALVKTLGEDEYQALSAKFDSLAEKIASIARQAGVGEAVSKKAGATGDKLGTMRDTYIQEAWDDPAELLEWLGFFVGAAIVHWSLVKGAAETLGDQELLSFAQDGLKTYQDLFLRVVALIENVGRERAA